MNQFLTQRLSDSDPEYRSKIHSIISEGATSTAETLSWTFILPNMSDFEDDFKTFLKGRLCQRDHLLDLQRFKVINWDRAPSPLTPLKTTGDGNCLLHASSLAMWGIQDQALVLRTKLREMLHGPLASTFHQRWCEAYKKSTSSTSNMAPGFVKLQRQVTITAQTNQYGQKRYEYLEQLHAFALAHVLKRPIVIYSDPYERYPNGDIMATLTDEQRMDGIYLPLLLGKDELPKRDESGYLMVTPLIITFSRSHFSACVGSEPKSDEIISTSINTIETTSTTSTTTVTNTTSDTNTTSTISSMSTTSTSTTSTTSTTSVTTILPSISNSISTCTTVNNSIATTTTATTTTNTVDNNSSKSKVQKKFNCLHFPIVDVNRKPLPIHFLTKDEAKDKDTILRQWLDVKELASKKDGKPILTMVQKVKDRPQLMDNLLERYFAEAKDALDNMTSDDKDEMFGRVQKVLCKGGCGFMGSSKTANLCSKCYKKRFFPNHDQPTGQCKSFNCTFAGSSKNNGYCSVCFKKQKTNVLNKCLGGCGFFGSPENQGFCSSCLKKGFPNSGIQMPFLPSNNFGMTEIKVANTQCLNKCGMFGSPANQGLCSKCLKEKLANAKPSKAISVRGTVWFWNNWTNVELRVNGQFWSPDCPEGGKWEQHGDIINISWGRAGLHTVKISNDGKKLNGKRHDGDPCAAIFVKKLEIKSSSGSKCKISGCPFAGTTEKGGYCSQCYKNTFTHGIY